MGWDSSPNWKTKTQVINAIIDQYHPIGKFNIGNEFWMLLEHNGEKEIAVAILEKDKTYAYKVMYESEFPFYFRCPKHWLKLAKCKSEEWRLQVSCI